ncbi:MAG TPA: DUF732 domain-containing protein, partial [Mycobacterium sp.]|nr:DUF732 domain-containing protein [Mycobacterium sp.]
GAWRGHTDKLPAHPLTERYRSAMKLGVSLAAVIVAATFSGGALPLAPLAHAAPAPEVEYLYDVTVRRQYSFATPADAVNYGHRICDKISQGASYAQLMNEVKNDVRPNDEFATNYLLSNAVNFFCPAQIWQLRNSAANYVPPPQ